MAAVSGPATLSGSFPRQSPQAVEFPAGTRLQGSQVERHDISHMAHGELKDRRHAAAMLLPCGQAEKTRSWLPRRWRPRTDGLPGTPRTNRCGLRQAPARCRKCAVSVQCVAPSRLVYSQVHGEMLSGTEMRKRIPRNLETSDHTPSNLI